MYPDLNGKVVFVTGAASGIGLASAKRFASEGCKVAVVDVNFKGAEVAAEQINAAGGQAVAIHCDVTSESDVKSALETTIKHFGTLDLCHNNAGILGERGSLSECTVENFDNLMAINVRGVFLCMKYELQIMVEKEIKGCIVNTASGAGMKAFPEFPAYTASKHAVLGLTRCASIEYAPKGIRVNAVCPATTDTPMVQECQRRWPEMQANINQAYPIGRIATPEEIANVVVFLCSSQSSFMAGASVCIDGAETA